MKELKKILFIALQSFAIAGVVCFAVCPFSCKISETGIEVIGGDYAPPILETVNVIDDKTVKVSFSESIKLQGFVITEHKEDESDSYEHSTNEELSLSLRTVTDYENKIPVNVVFESDNSVAVFNLEERTKIGKTYYIYGVVEDRTGNTLTFCVPFIGYNSQVVKMIMTEVRSVSDSKNDLREFVELLVIEDGNLAGIQIQIGGEESKSYDFPPIDVKRGEVIVFHAEKLGENIVDELSEDITLCKHTDSNDKARDLWGHAEKSQIGNNDDIIVLYDKVNEFVLDAVMFRKADTVSWTKNKQIAADLIDDAGIYESSDIDNANYTKGGTAPVGASAKHTLQRMNSLEILEQIQNEQEIEYPVKVDCESWQIVRGGYSPGTI